MPKLYTPQPQPAISAPSKDRSQRSEARLSAIVEAAYILEAVRR
jgi:hypothetical protein